MNGTTRRRASIRTLSLAAALVAFAGAASAGPERLDVQLVDLGEKKSLWSFSRAPEESALAGCAVTWITSENDLPAEGDLLLVCVEDGRLDYRKLADAGKTLRDLTVEAGPKGALRVLLAHEDRIEERLISARDGSLSEPHVLLDGQGFSRGALSARPDFDGDGSADLQLATWSGVAGWRRTRDGYEPLASARLPPRASMSRYGPDMTVSGWSFLGGDDRVTRWTSPEERPGKRLSSWRIPLTSEGFGEPCEAWIATPEPLRVQRAKFAETGGREILATITVPSEKFSLFGEGALVVAEPVCDETRRGRPPILVADTSFAPWFPPAIKDVEDYTGDGLDDIVLVGYSGKLNVNAEIRLHEGLPGGGWKERPDRWEEDADSGGLTWDSDLDGDGYHDLLLRDAGKLEIYRGLPPEAGEVPLENSPSWRARLPRDWDPSWNTTWQIDAEGRHAILAWLSHEDDERSGVAFVLVPFSGDGVGTR